MNTFLRKLQGAKGLARPRQISDGRNSVIIPPFTAAVLTAFPQPCSCRLPDKGPWLMGSISQLSLQLGTEMRVELWRGLLQRQMDSWVPLWIPALSLTGFPHKPTPSRGLKCKWIFSRLCRGKVSLRKKGRHHRAH